MGNRRTDRQLALQLLFSIDINPTPIENAIKDFRLCFANSEPTPFFLQIVNGVAVLWSEIDTFIQKTSKNWTINRMSAIDRNILRIGVYELLYCEDIPARVSINEAIDISKKFGTYESGAFINGILDKINKELQEKNKNIGGNCDT
ncbi:MAG: transcription antitermination factor NusB [Deltaproteobacteria bacterium]|nr:transcription antitermination factor NusB [Deltaproteobacteria bacterium]